MSDQLGSELSTWGTLYLHKFTEWLQCSWSCGSCTWVAGAGWAPALKAASWLPATTFTTAYQALA